MIRFCSRLAACLLTLAVLAAAPPAIGQTFDAALTKFAADSFNDTEEGITGVAASGSPRAQTIIEALRDLTKREQGLATHFFDEAGALRRNILLIHNDDYIRARDGLARPLRHGDRIAIANRVSGG